VETEPVIIINGQRLTPAQALTVRCALDAFRTVPQTMGLPGTVADSRRLTEAYLARLAEIQALIGAPFPDTSAEA
jgi:hypothetical protein